MRNYQLTIDYETDTNFDKLVDLVDSIINHFANHIIAISKLREANSMVV